MAVFSDRDIQQALDIGMVEIEGLVPGSIQPASIDFHLSDRPFKVWDRQGLVSLVGYGINLADRCRNADPIVPWLDQSDEMIEVPHGWDPDGNTPCFRLESGQFALASTTERVRIGPRLAGRLEGKSSLARLGLIVHTTAGFFDPGFEGYPTLELLNVAPRPMLLRPDMPIAQMAFFAMTSGAATPYNERGHYTDQGADPEPSHYFENFA